MQDEGRRDQANASMKDTMDKAKRSLVAAVDKAKAKLDKRK